MRRAPLAQVELGVGLLVDVLNLDQRLVLILVDLAPAGMNRCDSASDAPSGTTTRSGPATGRGGQAGERLTACSRGYGPCSTGCTARRPSSPGDRVR